MNVIVLNVHSKIVNNVNKKMTWDILIKQDYNNIYY